MPTGFAEAWIVTDYPLLDEFGRSIPFVTTQFDDGLFESVYRYSLTKVKRTFRVAEAYDLWQCLEHARTQRGQFIEFGTFRGHSGLLMAEFLKRYRLRRRLYLCDTFSEFPQEPLEIDRRWSGTHKVEFAKIKERFTPYKFVELVRGDFTETADSIPDDRLAFALVDCDSYRGTSFAADWAWGRLARGGVIFFQDYGQPQCPGARLAVDEFLKGRRGAFAFFSFFSGARIVLKV